MSVGCYLQLLLSFVLLRALVIRGGWPSCEC